MGITARLCPFTPSCVQRFLISSPDLEIDASFSPITPFCVQRFRISGQDLRIDAAEKSSACSGRSGNEVRVRFYSSLPQRRMVPPVVVVAATRSASDSILRFREGEWFRLQQSSRLRRIACLPQSRWVQAGTGCHEGGIILSKKPPEWRLSPPYQCSASESNLLCRNNVLRPKLIFVASMKGRYVGRKTKVGGKPCGFPPTRFLNTVQYSDDCPITARQGYCRPEDPGRLR